MGLLFCNKPNSTKMIFNFHRSEYLGSLTYHVKYLQADKHIKSLCNYKKDYWWIVKSHLTGWLMVCAQNFLQVVGTYKGYLPLSESRWGGDSTWRWWGHLTTILHN